MGNVKPGERCSIPRAGWCVAWALALTGSVNVAPAQSADPFANWLDGAEGFERAMDRRRGTSDAVLLYFYTDWCPHCRRFDQQVAASREVGEYVRHAIAVRINPEHGTREKALAERHGVTGYPTLLVLPPGMEQTQNVTAYRGSPQEFVEACEAAGSKRAVKKSLSAAQPTSSVATRPKPAPNPPPQKAQATPKPPASPAKNTVYLKNGNVMEGTVQAVNEQGFVLEVEGIGRLTLSRAEVVSVDGPLPGK